MENTFDIIIDKVVDSYEVVNNLDYIGHIIKGLQIYNYKLISGRKPHYKSVI